MNYMWAHFFGRGIVDPPDTFDPARLDPDNPPPAPWTLQPSNAALLNALAQHFVDSGYNLKALMREIVNCDTYQLSSRYDGDVERGWEPYFARKFVRRLWGEEMHRCGGAVERHAAQSYTVTGFTDQGFGKPSATPCSFRTWSDADGDAPTRSSTASSAATATTSRARATAPSCRRST